jgi:hypothetical protein
MDNNNVFNVETSESYRKLCVEIFDKLIKKAEEVEKLPLENFAREMNFDPSQKERWRSSSDLELFKEVCYPFAYLDISLKDLIKERYENIDAKITNGKLELYFKEGEDIQPPENDGFLGYSAFLADMETRSIAKLKGDKHG